MENFDPKIHSAVCLLSSLCDGAATEDGQGFNKLDSGFGKSLAKKPIEQWTVKMAHAAYVMIHKYHRQLQRNGIDFTQIVVPKIADKLKEDSLYVPKQVDNKRKARLLDDRITLNFPYDPFVIDKVKTIDGRKYHPKNKTWSVPNTAFAIAIIEELGFNTDRLKQDSDIVVDAVPGIKKELRPFQKEAVAFIEKKKGRALVGDEMGLGKTLEALSWVVYKGKEALPALVVCPASVKSVWAKEIRESTELTYFIAEGRKPLIPEPVDVVIINYDILSYWEPLLDPATVILDESHFIKNKDTKRAKAAKDIVKKAKHFLPLSGTPIVNRPVEFFTTLELLRPDIFNNFWLFAKQYCGAKNNGYGWDFSGASNTDKLNRILSDVMIRRKKEDVLKDLPEKTLSVIPLTASKKYVQLEREFYKRLDIKNTRTVLTEIEAQKQAAVGDKMDQAIQWIEDFLNSDQKLVVFATHRKTIDTLMEKFKGSAVKIDGSVAQDKRQGIVDSFQNDSKVNLFIGNIKAAGVGITLTAASNVLFLEFPWTPGDLNQAEDRIHRIGQKYPANIHYMILQNSIEEDIVELLDYKRTILNQVLDGESTEESTNILRDLLERFGDR